MAAQLRWLAIVLGAGLVAVALASGYWAAVRGAALAERGDNPRRLLLERRTPRGTIFDRNGAVLAEAAGSPGELFRRYPYPRLAPVVGYVSPFYGTAGIEAAYDGVLHGDADYSDFELLWLNDLLAAPPPGRAVRLTIDLAVQPAVDAALGARTGAVVAVDAVTGQILALASHPTYDPNTFEAEAGALVADPAAPLINRAVQAQYQPGGALWPVVVAAAAELDNTLLTTPQPDLAAAVVVDGQTITCRETPSEPRISLSEALRQGCPGPALAAGQRLGPAGLAQLFQRLQLTEAPAVPLAAAGAGTSTIGDPGLAAIGQGNLTVTPLHMALMTAAIARQGQLPAPHLVLATETRDGQWRTEPPPAHSGGALNAAAAKALEAIFAPGYEAIAISSAGGTRLAWFLGYAPAADPRVAVAVLLEDGDSGAARAIGEAALYAAAGRP